MKALELIAPSVTEVGRRARGSARERRDAGADVAFAGGAALAA
jgi:hypothetical protein